MSHLEHEFEAAMWRSYPEAKKLGYNAAYFARMLDELGGVATAKKLINSPSASEGFERLWSLHHLELTVEAVASEPQFRSLFTREELETCRARLEALGYLA